MRIQQQRQQQQSFWGGSLRFARMSFDTHTPNLGYPPSPSSIAPPFEGHVHSLPRAVGEALENEGQQITGGNEDEGIGGWEGMGQEGGRAVICAAGGVQIAPWLAPATPTQVNNQLRRGSRHKQRHAPPP
eukprot:822429-Pyramimonas_sp.AAC.1